MLASLRESGATPETQVAVLAVMRGRFQSRFGNRGGGGGYQRGGYNNQRGGYSNRDDNDGDG